MLTPICWCWVLSIGIDSSQHSTHEDDGIDREFHPSWGLWERFFPSSGTTSGPRRTVLFMMHYLIWSCWCGASLWRKRPSTDTLLLFICRLYSPFLRLIVLSCQLDLIFGCDYHGLSQCSYETHFLSYLCRSRSMIALWLLVDSGLFSTLSLYRCIIIQKTLNFFNINNMIQTLNFFYINMTSF